MSPAPVRAGSRTTGKIEELIYSGRETYTVVIVTHNMQQAARVSDQCGIFFMGELVSSVTQNHFHHARDKTNRKTTSRTMDKSRGALELCNDTSIKTSRISKQQLLCMGAAWSKIQQAFAGPRWTGILDLAVDVISRITT